MQSMLIFLIVKFGLERVLTISTSIRVARNTFFHLTNSEAPRTPVNSFTGAMNHALETVSLSRLREVIGQQLFYSSTEKGILRKRRPILLARP